MRTSLLTPWQADSTMSCVCFCVCVCVYVFVFVWTLSIWEWYTRPPQRRFWSKSFLFVFVLYLFVFTLCSFDNTVLAYEQNVWGPDGLCVHCASLAARPKHQFANRIHYAFRKKYSFWFTPVSCRHEWNQIQNLQRNKQYSHWFCGYDYYQLYHLIYLLALVFFFSLVLQKQYQRKYN